MKSYNELKGIKVGGQRYESLALIYTDITDPDLLPKVIGRYVSNTTFTITPAGQSYTVNVNCIDVIKVSFGWKQVAYSGAIHARTYNVAWGDWYEVPEESMFTDAYAEEKGYVVNKALTAPTQAQSDSSTKIANTFYVRTAIENQHGIHRQLATLSGVSGYVNLSSVLTAAEYRGKAFLFSITGTNAKMGFKINGTVLDSVRYSPYLTVSSQHIYTYTGGYFRGTGRNESISTVVDHTCETIKIFFGKADSATVYWNFFAVQRQLATTDEAPTANLCDFYQYANESLGTGVPTIEFYIPSTSCVLTIWVEG